MSSIMVMIALLILAFLAAIGPEGSMTGYSREKFPHWARTGSNCDVRDTILARDGSQIRYKDCNVVGGKWLSSYDHKSVTEVRLVHIDHLVPLAEAWRSGAKSWSLEKRTKFANDPENLKAVSASANLAKGDQDLAQWLPVYDRCEYINQWRKIKIKYGLSSDLEELKVEC